jgi:hypothetical protein
MFNVPVRTDNVYNIGIKFDSKRAKFMKDKVKLLVWDEYSASHRGKFEAVDKFFKGIKENKLPFGGITVVLTGDAQQTLPIIKKANRVEVINSVVTNSYLFKKMFLKELTINLRVKLNKSEEKNIINRDYISFINKIGLDKIPHNKKLGNNIIEIPKSICLDTNDASELVDNI